MNYTCVQLWSVYLNNAVLDNFKNLLGYGTEDTGTLFHCVKFENVYG